MLEGQMDGHLGYEKHERSGQGSSPMDIRAKIVDQNITSTELSNSRPVTPFSSRADLNFSEMKTPPTRE
ncbi:MULTISPECIES: hypothetical protein [Sphingobacterium]|uniref:hypothetical protein n=1 Tax=Sphingobacterium TaxID=28453 RepID=UPI00257E10CB|nr:MULTISPECIES: hypothetical protein [Sphingobacterium]